MVDRFSSPLLVDKRQGFALELCRRSSFKGAFSGSIFIDLLVEWLEKVPRIFSQMPCFTVMNPMVESATKSPSTNKSLRL